MKTLIFKLHAETELPLELIESIPQSGPADSAIEYALENYAVEVSLADSIAYLKSTGGWDIAELQDIDLNKSRLLWIACLDCRENNSTYWYMGE